MMCRLHPEYLELLYASDDISSLSAVGLRFKAKRQTPLPDQVTSMHTAYNSPACTVLIGLSLEIVHATVLGTAIYPPPPPPPPPPCARVAFSNHVQH